MKALFYITFSLIFAVNSFVFAGTDRLGQTKGIWQNQQNKQIDFISSNKIPFDFDKIPLREIKKILLYKDHIFVLDSKRNQIFVMDKKGGYLYTIGKPGQGPGDVEYGWDFSISADGNIYVLCSMSRRIEVFNIEGKPIKTIRLNSPDDSLIPDSFSIAKNKTIITGAKRAPLVSIFSEDGKIKKELLNLSYTVNNTGAALAIPSRVLFHDTAIFYLDMFRGEFYKLNETGSSFFKFSVFSENTSTPIRDILDRFDNQKNSKAKPSQFMTFTLWSDFCMDKNNQIYVIPLAKKKDEPQPMYVFSRDGVYLYEKILEFSKSDQIKNIACDDECFVFGSSELDLTISFIRRK